MADNRVNIEGGNIRRFEAPVGWPELFSDPDIKTKFEKVVLPDYLMSTRWFGSKAKSISSIVVDILIPVKVEWEQFYLLILKVDYDGNEAEHYFLPLGFVKDNDYLESLEYTPQSILCSALLGSDEGVIIDGMFIKALRDFMYVAISEENEVSLNGGGFLKFLHSDKVDLDLIPGSIDSQILKVEQSNTAVIYDNKYFFKIYRKVEKHINPEIELFRFLTEKSDFRNVPLFAGGLEYFTAQGHSIMLGMMLEKVNNKGDAWELMLDRVGEYYERVLDMSINEDPLPEFVEDWTLSFDKSPEIIQDLIGRDTYNMVSLLGQRTAQMHLALASDDDDPDFAPEPFTGEYQERLYGNFKNLVEDRFALLQNNMAHIPSSDKEFCRQLLEKKQMILNRFGEIQKPGLVSARTRIHGDYHLGQVLFTGDDFVIIDFEGEPGTPFPERRMKQSPLKDVAGMIRSFHYASFGKIALSSSFSEAEKLYLQPWAEQWQHYILRYYLNSYYKTKNGTDELSENDSILLRIYVLEKAIYELGYELNSRLDWVKIPLNGIQYLLSRFSEKD